MVGIHLIVGHCGIMSSQRLILRAGHDGVHKETARITRHLRIGQLSVSDVNDGLAQLLGRRLGYPFLLQLSADIPVVQMRMELSREPVGHIGDEVAVFPLMLKTTLTIGIATVRLSDGHHLTSGNLHRLDGLYQVLGLHPVCTDILDGTRPHVTGNQRQVLQPVESCHQGCLDDLVKHLPTATGHPVSFKTDSQDVRAYYDTIEILGQQQVTASPYNNIRCIRRPQDGSRLPGLFHRRIFHEPCTLGIDSKCVMSLQTIITLNPHVVIFINRHAPPIFLNRSSNSSPLATPRNRRIISPPEDCGFPYTML